MQMLWKASKNHLKTGLCRSKRKFFSALPILVAITGCSATSAVSTYVSPNAAALVPATGQGGDAPAEFYAYYKKSLQACQKYEQQVVDSNNSFNAFSDIGTLIYTTLASVFTPISTVHALTAAAAITTGMKSAVDTDITADDTVNISIALDKTYFIPMAQLSQQAFAEAITDANLPGFEAQVDNYQIQCSISQARVYIRQNLSSALAVSAQGKDLPGTGTTPPGTGTPPPTPLVPSAPAGQTPSLVPSPAPGPSAATGTPPTL